MSHDLVREDHQAAGDHDCDKVGCFDHEFGTDCNNLECYAGDRGPHHHHLKLDPGYAPARWYCDDIDPSCFQLEYHSGACFTIH